MKDFDPAATFLLELPNYESLFEQADSRDETLFRCKGCRQPVKRWRRLDHFKTHQTLMRRAEEVRKTQLTLDRLENLARARDARRKAKEAA